MSSNAIVLEIWITRCLVFLYEQWSLGREAWSTIHDPFYCCVPLLMILRAVRVNCKDAFSLHLVDYSFLTLSIVEEMVRTLTVRFGPNRFYSYSATSRSDSFIDRQIGNEG